jgi:hypothetical protein
MSQYAIYDHPTDFPDSFVVREWKVSGAGVEAGSAQTADSLEQARALVPPGLQLLPDFEDDDPKIVEVWG